MKVAMQQCFINQNHGVGRWIAQNNLIHPENPVSDSGG